jgi:hypothetical protein
VDDVNQSFCDAVADKMFLDRDMFYFAMGVRIMCTGSSAVRFGVQPVGILVVEEGRKGGRDEIGQNSGLCEHL